MLAVIALMVFYIVNVFRNDRVDKDKKALWAVVLFMGNMIAMPIYWYLYIWRETPAPDSPLQPQPSKLG
jgi:cytosine/uracil/thiamine/allantoin permease